MPNAEGAVKKETLLRKCLSEISGTSERLVPRDDEGKRKKRGKR